MTLNDDINEILNEQRDIKFSQDVHEHVKLAEKHGFGFSRFKSIISKLIVDNDEDRFIDLYETYVLENSEDDFNDPITWGKEFFKL